MKKIFVVLSLVLFAVACSKSVLPTASEGDAQRASAKWPNTTTKELAQGKILYEQNCGKCHKLHSPASESEEEWNRIVPKMAKKAKVNSETENLILRYVVTMSTAPKQ